MKNFFFAIILSIFAFVNFQSKASGGDSDFEVSGEMTHIPAMILVEDMDMEDAILELENQGIIVLRHRGNIILAFVPLDYKSELRRAKGFKSIEYSKPRFNSPMMKDARSFNNADWINSGNVLPQPYSGKGIVVGVCDIGIDTRHPNFLTSDLSECRIRKVVQYRELLGLRKELNTPQEIYDWETDDSDDWHATHVTGIAAGAYGAKDGEGYYSIAYDADIVFTASQLSDVGLLAGVEDIIEYAQSVGKPAVINLSMGNYLGPHDGSSLFTRYLDLCAEDAIICLSAGNEGKGTQARSMSFDFSENKPMVEVKVNDWAGLDFTGEAEVWSKDSTPFDFTFYWNNNSSYDKNEYPYQAIKFTEDGPDEWRISADPSDPDYDQAMAAHHKGGYVVVTGGISPLNGRYFVNLSFNVQTDIHHFNGDIETGWAEWWPSLRVEAEAGTHIDIFGAGGSFLRQERNSPAPDNKLCISDLATGFRTISVGMTNNTATPDSDHPDPVPGSGYAKGDVNVNSSYGTIGERVFPLTCAPGILVVSSINSAYLREHPEEIEKATSFSVPFGDGKAYWAQNGGTSMSCPFVVSAIATWLQANPRLTSEDVISIIKETNQKSGFPNESDPRHGQGWFNPYTGLQQVLSMAALNVGSVDSPGVTCVFKNGELIIGNPSGSKLSVSVHAVSGLMVECLNFNESLGQLSLLHLDKGVYVVVLTDETGRTETLKIKI